MAASLFQMSKWLNGSAGGSGSTAARSGEERRARALMLDVEEVGSRVQAEHAPGPADAFHGSNTPVVLSRSPR